MTIFNSLNNVDDPVTYRNNRPKDRALVISNGSVTYILDYIGPGLDYLCDDLDNLLQLNPGIWIWEGSLEYGQNNYDLLLIGDVRYLTNDEMEHYRNGEAVWDDELWITYGEEN